MSLAVYGRELGQEETADLMLPYIRRKKFEARLLALELAGLLAGGAGTVRARTPGSDRVSADALFSEMGITIQ